MVSEHTWIAGIALVLAIGLIAFQLVPQQTARQVPDASDSVAMERIGETSLKAGRQTHWILLSNFLD